MIALAPGHKPSCWLQANLFKEAVLSDTLLLVRVCRSDYTPALLWDRGCTHPDVAIHTHTIAMRTA